MNEQSRHWRCGRCNEPLVERKVVFQYMGRSFGHAVPACPQCGQTFISKELAQGKMAEVEALMEDK